MLICPCSHDFARRPGHCEAHIQIAAHTLRIQQPQAIALQTNIELDCRTISHPTRRGHGTAADVPGELGNVKPIGAEGQHAVTLGQSNGRIWGSKTGIHDTNLALNIFGGPVSGCIDVKLKLSATGYLRIEHLCQGQVDRSLHAQRRCSSCY